MWKPNPRSGDDNIYISVRVPEEREPVTQIPDDTDERRANRSTSGNPTFSYVVCGQIDASDVAASNSGSGPKDTQTSAATVWKQY